MEPRLNNNLTAYRKKNSCETSLVKLVEPGLETDTGQQTRGRNIIDRPIESI